MENIRTKNILGILEKSGNILLNIIFSIGLGFLITNANFNNNFSPFALSMLSVSPFAKLSQISIYAGVVLGYITKDFSIYNFKYICANTIMIAIIMFLGRKNYVNKIYSPLLSSLICFTVGIVFILTDEFSVYNLMLLLCESVICGCSSYFIKYFIDAVIHKSKLNTKDIISFNITLLIFIWAIDRYYIYNISLSLVFVILLIYLSSYYLKRSTAAIFTLILCLAITVLHPEYDNCLIILYIPSLATILISKYSINHCITLFCIPYYCILTLNGIYLMNFNMILSPFISAIIFYIIPKIKLSNILSEYIHLHENHSDSETDNNVLSDDYCHYGKKLINSINYTKVSPIVTKDIERKIIKSLFLVGCREIQVSNYYNNYGYQTISITCKESNVDLNFIKTIINKHCKKTLILAEQKKQGKTLNLKFEQIDIFKIECFALYKSKNGENVCGDNVTAFKSLNSEYNLLLADGMGSGKEAYSKSYDTVSMLKKLLKSCITPENAIKTVNTSLCITKDEIGFSTIDLCNISLETGIAKFFKCGSYISYILRNNKLIQINTGGIPAGLTDYITYNLKLVQLEEEDIIIMMSDGVSNAIDKLKAVMLIENHDNLKLYSKKLLDCAYINTPNELDDDMTIFVAKVKVNNIE